MVFFVYFCFFHPLCVCCYIECICVFSTPCHEIRLFRQLVALPVQRTEVVAVAGRGDCFVSLTDKDNNLIFCPSLHFIFSFPLAVFSVSMSPPIPSPLPHPTSPAPPCRQAFGVHGSSRTETKCATRVRACNTSMRCCVHIILRSRRSACM